MTAGLCSSARCQATELLKMKSALDQLVRGAAPELGPRGVRVNAAHQTWSAHHVLMRPWPRILESTAIAGAYVADPKDIAGFLLFLISKTARSIGGVLLSVDGGVSAIGALPKLPLKEQASKNRP